MVFLMLQSVLSDMILFMQHLERCVRNMPQEHLEYGLLTTFNKIFTLPGIELAEVSVTLLLEGAFDCHQEYVKLYARVE